ncbi:uncharacterized protein LOC144357884 [Saccoglossus kowalevskii]
MLYGCESWTMTTKITKKINAFEMKCYRRFLGITWRQKIRNEEIWMKLKDQLKEGQKKRIMQGKVEGCRNRGRRRREWEDDIKERTENGEQLYYLADDRKGWRRCVWSWVHQRPPEAMD